MCYLKTLSFFVIIFCIFTFDFPLCSGNNYKAQKVPRYQRSRLVSTHSDIHKKIVKTSQQQPTLTFEQKLRIFRLKQKSLHQEALLGWLTFALNYGLCFLAGTVDSQHILPQYKLRLLAPFVGSFAYGVGVVEKAGSHHGLIALVFMMPLYTLVSIAQLLSVVVAIRGHVLSTRMAKPKNSVLTNVFPWFQGNGGGVKWRASF